jgi:type I restriction enzyme, S subunit
MGWRENKMSNTVSQSNCEWKECKLGDVAEVINGFAFKSGNFIEEKKDGALPVIKIKNVANGDVNLNGVQYHEFDNKLSKFLVKNGDVLLSLTGNHPQAMTQVVGEASKYKLNEYALLNQRVAKIKPKEELLNNFLYYLLKDDVTHENLANKSSGSANQANISKNDVENLDILLPPLPEQKAIASVLSSLDDKIDLLHRQNKTLEAMAETLFRQWFVEEADEEETVEIGSFADNIKKSIKVEELKNYEKYVGLEHIPRKNIALDNFGTPGS